MRRVLRLVLAAQAGSNLYGKPAQDFALGVDQEPALFDFAYLRGIGLTGGCTAYDVVVILKKSGQDVRGCEVKVTSERAPTDPKVFTRIHLHFVVRGRGLKRNLVEQAIRLSHEKYCSASIMLGKTAEITKDFELIED